MTACLFLELGVCLKKNRIEILGDTYVPSQPGPEWSQMDIADDESHGPVPHDPIDPQVPPTSLAASSPQDPAELESWASYSQGEDDEVGAHGDDGVPGTPEGLADPAEQEEEAPQVEPHVSEEQDEPSGHAVEEAPQAHHAEEAPDGAPQEPHGHQEEEALEKAYQGHQAYLHEEADDEAPETRAASNPWG